MEEKQKFCVNCDHHCTPDMTPQQKRSYAEQFFHLCHAPQNYDGMPQKSYHIVTGTPSLFDGAYYDSCWEAREETKQGEVESCGPDARWFKEKKDEVEDERDDFTHCCQ